MKYLCTISLNSNSYIVMRKLNLLMLLMIISSSFSFAQLHTYKWKNENKKAEGVVKEGLEQGKWTFWSKEGVIQQEVNYKDSEFHGHFIN